MKDGALRVDTQCTLEVIFGQFELLLSKVLFCLPLEISNGRRRAVVIRRFSVCSRAVIHSVRQNPDDDTYNSTEAIPSIVMPRIYPDGITVA